MASNLVVARGGVEFVPPISLAFWRWTIVFLILLPFTYLSLKRNYKICVRATVVDGLSQNYRVWVVKEAVGDRNLTAQDANLHDMNAKYAEVVSLSEAIDHLRQIGGHL